VVGGGSGAVGLVEGLRGSGFAGPITVISNEGYLPIDRTKVSKALVTDAAKLALRDEEWYKSGAVEMVTDEVVEVDFAAKTVLTKKAASYEYAKLALATGGVPRTLPLPGFRVLGNIFTLRNVHDAVKIVDALGPKGKKVVVIGSSFIGLEVANATCKDNKVSVVGMEKAPLQAVLGEQVGKGTQKGLEEKGIEFYMSASVDKAEPSTADPAKVGSVVLRDGTRLEADVVVLGVGVAPATEFLRTNGMISLEPDGSVRTDENFAVVGLEDVYAVGDIAKYPYHGPGGGGGLVRIEHWNVAQNAGRTAAAHIARRPASTQPFVPVFWSALARQLRYCGNTVASGWDDVVVQGQPEEGKFAAFYCKGETVAAVAAMAMDPLTTQAAELMRLGKMPSKSDLKNGLDILRLGSPS